MGIIAETEARMQSPVLTELQGGSGASDEGREPSRHHSGPPPGPSPCIPSY